MESENEIKNDGDVSCEMKDAEVAGCCCYEVDPCGCDFDPYECGVDTYCC